MENISISSAGAALQVYTAAQLQTQARNRAIAAAVLLRNATARINGQVLQTTTLDPGETAGGLVLAKAPPSAAYGATQPIDVIVKWNGSEHDFKFNIKPLS